MNSEKLLVLLLRLNAGILCLAIPTLLLPVSTMDQIHRWLGMGALPHQPITEYLARSCSLMYGVHGIVLLLISLKPRKHWSLIGPLALLHVGMGATLLCIDLFAGMPWYWTAVEGGPIMIFGCILFALWIQASRS